jgi:hypothetical protein
MNDPVIRFRLQWQAKGCQWADMYGHRLREPHGSKGLQKGGNSVLRLAAAKHLDHIGPGGYKDGVSVLDE